MMMIAFLESGKRPGMAMDPGGGIRRHVCGATAMPVPA
jgi:hypothetical protein